jgi:hypothetical protein
VEGFALPYERAANFERHINEFIRDWNAESVLEQGFAPFSLRLWQM